MFQGCACVLTASCLMIYGTVCTTYSTVCGLKHTVCTNYSTVCGDSLPPAWETKSFPKMWDHTYANMLAMLDSAVGNLTAAVKHAGLWDTTLILFTAVCCTACTCVSDTDNQRLCPGQWWHWEGVTHLIVCCRLCLGKLLATQELRSALMLSVTPLTAASD